MKPKRLARIPTKYQKSVENELHRLSQAIQLSRQKKEMTQEVLAEKLGIGTTTLQSIERERRYPSLPTLFYICQFLGIEIQIHPPK